MPVPNKLRELMFHYGFGYPELAAEAETKESTVRAWAAGNASQNIKEAFARLCKLTVDELDSRLNG